MVNGSGVAVMMVLVLILLFSISKSALCKVSVEQMCIHMELKQLIQICCVADKVSFDIVGGGFFWCVIWFFFRTPHSHTIYLYFRSTPNWNTISKTKVFFVISKRSKIKMITVQPTSNRKWNDKNAINPSFFLIKWFEYPI